MTARAFSTFTFTANVGFLAGANILDIASIGVSSGVLSNDSSVVADAFSKINAEVVVHPDVKVDGIKPDGSFSQHTVGDTARSLTVKLTQVDRVSSTTVRFSVSLSLAVLLTVPVRFAGNYGKD